MKEKAGQEDEKEAQLGIAGEEEDFFFGDKEGSREAGRSQIEERGEKAGRSQIEGRGAKAGRSQIEGRSRKAGREKCARCTGRRVARWIRGLVRWAVGCVLWWCRLGWNFCVALAAGGAAFCGLVCLYFLGLLSVLWCQGYPFLGVVLGCFGVVLCFVSLSVLGCTFFWVKPEKKPEREESRKPAQGGEKALGQGTQDGLESSAG